MWRLENAGAPYLEEGVHEKDPVRLDGRGVQQYRLGGAGE